VLPAPQPCATTYDGCGASMLQCSQPSGRVWRRLLRRREWIGR
jgi:hypothetical protein